MRCARWFLVSSLFLGLLLASSSAMAGRCVVLGWTGGAAKKNFKWVKGWVENHGGRRFTISYAWHGGKMRGYAFGNHYRGTWRQTNGAWGRFSLHLPHGSKKIVFGWWSKNKGSAKYALAVKRCRSAKRIKKPKCIKLGWTGGTARKNFKWVKGWLTDKGGRKFVIRYHWKGGKMTGHHDGPRYHGIWRQRGGEWGKFSLHLPRGRRKMVFGWWSKKRSPKKYALAVRLCR